MHLTRSVSYAVGVLLRLAHESQGGAMTAAQISRGCKFPPRFLYRILRRLVDAGLVRGVSGPGGGYTLAKPTSKITLLDIVQAVEGAQPPDKLPAVAARQRRAMQRVNKLTSDGHRQFCQRLKRVTLANLARS